MIPRDQKRNGQTLVQIALLMVVILACMVIAIDVGHLFTERRRMQNAADAGALAGAWEICFGDPDMAVATAEETAVDKNGAQVAEVSIDEWRVTVHASEEADLYLAGIFGILKSDVGAVAVAACGDAHSASEYGCGYWPISFSKHRWDKIPYGTEGADDEEGVFYVFTDGRFEEDDPCYGKDSNGGCVPMCDVENPHEPDGEPKQQGYCECDLIPPDNHIYRVGPGHRGWLLFPRTEPPFDELNPQCGDNCGDQVRCWIEAGSLKGIPLPMGDGGYCLPGDLGVHQSVRIEIEQQLLAIPNLTPKVLLWDDACPPGDPDTVGTCPGNLYHIVGMGCVKIEAVEEVNLEKDEDFWSTPDKTQYCLKNVKVIRARKIDDCKDPCGGTHGDPPVPGQVRSVSLIK
jgi:hypothetical protein